MALSLRLSKRLEQALERAARLAGTSKSEYVRRCLEKDLAKKPMTLAEAYQVGKDLFGKYGSGRGDLARNSERIVREVIRAKASRRRRGSDRRAV